MENSQEKTIGEKRVRVDFNPSTGEIYGSVADLKNRTAKLINALEELKPEGVTLPGEQLRLISLAQTAYEEAAMWAVKAATF